MTRVLTVFPILDYFNPALLVVLMMWCGSVIVVLSGFRITFARSLFTCRARRIRMRREKA